MTPCRKHSWTRIPIPEPWWAFWRIERTYLGCPKCGISIDQHLEQLRAKERQILDHLAEIAARFGRPPRCGDDTCVDEHG